MESVFLIVREDVINIFRYEKPIQIYLMTEMAFSSRFGRGMQKRNFDSELKSLNDKPSNQASICKATSSPKLNGVF